MSEDEFAKRITIEFDAERPSHPVDITVAEAKTYRSEEDEILSSAEEVADAPTFLLKAEDIKRVNLKPDYPVEEEKLLAFMALQADDGSECKVKMV